MDTNKDEAPDFKRWAQRIVGKPITEPSEPEPAKSTPSTPQIWTPPPGMGRRARRADIDDADD